jgi:hypothetical protein
VKRKAKVAVISAVAGSTLLVGSGLAFPAFAKETGWDASGGPCVSDSASAPGRPIRPSAALPSGARPSFPGGGTPPSGAWPTFTQPGSPKSNKSSNGKRYDWSWWGRHRNSGYCPPTSDSPGPSDPTGSPTSSDPTGSPTSSDPTGSPTSSEPTGAPTSSASTRPPCQSSPTAECKLGTGNAVPVSGCSCTGTVTVTVKVCDGNISISSGKVDNGNWDANDQAIAALDKLAVEYGMTDISKLHFSGATMTSRAYQTSLRSALSNAGAGRSTGPAQR